MPIPQIIRATAQAVIRRPNPTAGYEFLVYESYDKIKKENFYRPVGGGVDFMEPAKDTVVREVFEELGVEVINPVFLGFSENIFTYQAQQGHEMVQVFHCEFKNKADYDRASFDVIEAGLSAGQAVWKSRDELTKPGVRFYPDGMKEIILKMT